MLTANGLRLLEYNARFGDPEAMNILPLLKTPLLDIFKSMIKKELSELKIDFAKLATVCKYLVPEGYPVSPRKNEPIEVNEEKIIKEGADLFYSSVSEVEPGKIITTTSRAIAIVGIADKLAKAEEIAEKATSYVKGPLFHRKDVGTKELVQKRIDHLKELNVL
jgi:phosphoribosylamine--glycine ligase